jgi:ADP-heptose:LPS heptosyltransferase
LGDCVLTTPALQILKRFRPDLRVAVAVEPRFREIFEGSPDVDSIMPPDLSALRRWHPRLCLNLHGGNRSAWLTALSGASDRVGFGHFRHQMVYNRTIPRAQQILKVDRKVHTAEHLASAIFHLGASAGEIPRARLAASPDAEPFAVIHPVAAEPEKTWHAAGFLEVARHLGPRVIFVGGAADDLSPFHAFPTLKGASLTRIKSLLAAAPVFVGNDSGPAHMAAAFGVPSVVLFGASDPAIWGPWRTPAEVLRAPGGISQIRATDVLGALAKLRVAA